jgi:hypothetical protein
MRANQNFSRELDLCPKIDPTLLSSNSVKTVVIDKLLALETGLGNLESQRKHESMLQSTRAKLWRKNQFKSSQVFYRTPRG